jgi:hypothetical protein
MQNEPNTSAEIISQNLFVFFMKARFHDPSATAVAGIPKLRHNRQRPGPHGSTRLSGTIAVSGLPDQIG